MRVAGRAIEHAAMPVRRVLVDAQVGHQHHAIADVGRKLAQRHLHDALRVERARAQVVLHLGNAEEDDRTDAEIGELAHLLAQAGASVLHHTRQRGDGLRLVDAFTHEQRRNELTHVELSFGNEVAHRCRAAQPPRP